jgi:CheY-like chemotaxis protein
MHAFSYSAITETLHARRDVQVLADEAFFLVYHDHRMSGMDGICVYFCE